MSFRIITTVISILLCSALSAQIVINEGSNKNASTLLDEDGELNDWIELYNAGTEAIDLAGYSLTDDASNINQWVFPNYLLEPGQHVLLFLSGKNRFASPAAVSFHTSNSFVPQIGWNNHSAQQSFAWDGVSNLVLNTCSYWSGGYTSNSIFNQTATDYIASVSSFIDGGDYACGSQFGEVSNLRPVLRINDIVVGENNAQNCNTCYPAPYGNWYFSARMQTIYRADDLLAAGLTAGTIDSLAFDVAYTDPAFYDYVSIQLTTTSDAELSNEYINTAGSFFHSNFGISAGGETIYLYNPTGVLESEFNVDLQSLNSSSGLFPDGSALTVLFAAPTPGATNNNSEPADGYTLQPAFSVDPGFYMNSQAVQILNPNGPQSTVRYTIDGSEPQSNSILYTGDPILLESTTVLKARVFEVNQIPGLSAVGTYFIGVDHVTPILSISTNNNNLYGPEGIFDNPYSDWLKSSFVEYFDSTAAHTLLMSQYTGMIMDGGLGGSRTQPQRSFRLKLADGIFGEGPMQHQVIPTIPYRSQYSDFYLRNGSNQYLALPYKDAAQVRMMSEGTHNYFTAWRPVTVYINGQYHGLYELREKFNSEKFEILDNAEEANMDLLSLSAYYGGILRAVEGDPQHYWDDWNTISQLDATAPSYVENVGQYFDLENYTDYFIGESFMSNVDWPWNNIKIYRSNATDFKWRFALQDLELGLAPNSWTDCSTNHIEWLFANTNGNPFTTPWFNMMQHQAYRLHFINRFADLLNTSYRAQRLLDIEQYHYDLILPEMPAYYARWADPNNVEGYVQWFNDNHSIFREQLACRGAQVRNHIQNQFGFASQQEITLAVYPPEAGRIQINTIIPDELPWNGIYFNGAPVTLTAIANPGYVFNYWISDTLLQSAWHNDTLLLNLSLDDTITAHFLGIAQPLEIDISEINYNDDETQPAGDWIELRNTGNGTVNLTGWSITNEVNTPRFEFPAATVLAPNQFLVIARDLVAFQSIHSNVENVVGNFYFSLPASGGTIRLLDHRDSIIREVHYLDESPWPLVADGGGRTLEYRADALAPSQPDNWFAGCMFGSPGTAYQPCVNEIVVSEINYASIPSANSGDWFEIRNIGNETRDVSGWKLRDDDWNTSLTLPAGSMLTPGASLVICASTTQFDAVHSALENRLGDMPFGLSGEGELIRIYDEQDKLNFSVYYQTESPWPIEANEGGYTLEWNPEANDINSSEAWFAGCVLGSPGTVYTPCDTTLVQNPSLQQKLSVYPNPASGSFFVQLPTSKDCSLKLINMNGAIVLEQQLSHTSFARIACNQLSSGIYILQITQADQQWNQRINLSGE